jgi:vacuolar-type H+-ATPase subunit I/STV1
MTKVTILGEATTEQKKLKPIEFTHLLNDTLKFNKDNILKVDIWENIELVVKNVYGYGYDLFIAYDVNRENCNIYLGHFNDGVAE